MANVRHVVFLFDVNSICSSQGQADSGGNGAVEGNLVENNENSRDSLKTESLDLLPFNNQARPFRPSDETLEHMKKLTLLTLFKEANNKKDYDLNRVQWTYKFFDSTRPVDYRDGRAFMPFNEESFCNFENQLHQRLTKPPGANAESMVGSQVQDGTGINYLSDALKSVTGTLRWPENSSLNMSLSRSFTLDEGPGSVNMVIVFMKVPRTEAELVEFSGLQATSSTKDLMGVLLPSAFSQRFHHQLKIQLNFVDMWGVPENSHVVDRSWNGQYPKQIVRCLTYLGVGRILPIPDLSSLRMGPTWFGLIPYDEFLRQHLKTMSAQNENVPTHSHILRLSDRNKASTTEQKISPENASSVSLNLRAPPSLLDSSLNSQNKILRPFRVSSGGYLDETDDHLEFHRRRRQAIMAQDRLREERKRKRHDEYETEDFYRTQMLSAHRRREYQRLQDDVGFDSGDTDSLFERDERLESWVNEGNFLPKRKKQVGTITSTAVPLSRPGDLNKSLPVVFHEPAPKTRGKKMLATIERHKGKVSAAESRRRSSEGMDLKRIAHQQEKELKAIKHRLIIHLRGELDDIDEPITWVKTYKKQLRLFADMILEEENPCTVALAQALVNHATTQFTLHRISEIKAAARNKYLTAKDVLEDILLIDFARLNKKIISGLEIMDKTAADELKVRKLLAFRETELQIILRLEIAWCFVEPDEDATEDLLSEIVRLLQIISVYRTQPPIDNFLNSVLLPTYRQSSRFMGDLYKRMNVPLPSHLAIDGSPIASASRRDDDSSVISSTSSVNLYPEDSASQLHLHKPKRHHPSPSVSTKRLKTLGARNTGSGRKANSGSKKSKRQFLVANSNPKLTTMQYREDKTDSQKKVVPGSSKVSPKRVRRNLFDVQKHDLKDSKTLLTLSTSRLTKSPGSFKSPKGKSPMSAGSGFFRAVRSRSSCKRQLIMGSQGSNGSGSNHKLGSPAVNSDVLCPESPATPGERRSVCSRYAASGESGERARIVQESPEIIKDDLDDRRMTKIASLSFYSTSNAAKSRAWERSEAQLMAARIKDSVDMRFKEGLTLSDLELLPNSPCVKPTLQDTETVEPSGTSFNFSNSFAEMAGKDELPVGHLQTNCDLQQLTGPAPGLDNPNIEALINSQVFPIPLISKDNELPALKTLTPTRRSGDSPTTSTGAHSQNNLQTPSKRVQFNLNENLINTPSSARRSSTGTPKSILKESHDT